MPVSGFPYPLTTPKPVVDSWDSTRLHLPGKHVVVNQGHTEME